MAVLYDKNADSLEDFAAQDIIWADYFATARMR
jgi:hypothetical protein